MGINSIDAEDILQESLVLQQVRILTMGWVMPLKKRGWMSKI